jgi:PAS domain S-box-containing protein
MENNRGSGTIIAYVLVGFFFGLVMVVLATVIALIQAGLAFTLSNIVQLHLSTPLLWVIDSFPFFLAVILGLLGARDRDLQRLRRESRDTQKKSTEVTRLNAELEKKEEERREFEEVISRGKREWEATFDSVVDMILLTDETGKIIRCNRAAARAFRLEFPDVIGKNVDELFFEAGTTEHVPTQKTEMKFPTLDGWYEVSSDPLTFQGEQQGHIYIVRNITDRKQVALDLERQKQFYESMVKNSPIGIITLSLDHRVVACNPAFEKLFGYKQQEVIGQNIDSLISPSELIDESLLLTYNVSQGDVVRKITRRRRKDGALVDVELFGIPVVLWGKQIGILGMYHNVSDLVRAELAEEEPTAELAVEEEMEPAEVIAEEAEDDSGGLGIMEAAAPLAGIFAAEKLVDSMGEDEEETEVEGVEPAAVGLAEMDAFEAEARNETVDEFASEPASEAASEPAGEAVVAVPAPRRRMIKVETIEGIGPIYAARLGEIGILTTEDLLTAGATRKGRQELVEKMGVSDKLILRWVNIADLMRVPGIGEEYSELLEAAGVDTVKELRNRNANNLYNALIVANNEKSLVRRVPHLTEVQSWVQAAKELEPRMRY